MEIRIRLRENKALGRQSVPLSVSLLRYAYDADAKRARQVVIGSVDFWADKLPDDLAAKLTLEEVNEWREFVVNRDDQARQALQRFHLKNVVRSIAHASKAIEAGEKPEDGQLLWSAMDVLAAALEKAGIPKEIRDRLQNHALQDVSSKHYDRWNYMVEKRAGMAKWDKFVRAMLAKKRVKAAA